MGSVGSGGEFKGEHYKFILRTMEDNIRPDKTESLIVINSNGDILIDKSDGKTDQVSITDDEIKLMKNATITHNHPGGSTFSWQDLRTLEYAEAHEMRAVGSNGITYSLVSNPGASHNLDFTFAYYTAENKYKSDVVDDIFAKSAQTQEDCDRCNNMLNEYRRKWLKENAKAYGYTYTERKVKK